MKGYPDSVKMKYFCNNMVKKLSLKKVAVIISMFFAGLLCILTGCSTSKNTTLGQGMQNLTARYNILYNARLLLEDSQRSLQTRYADDYSQILSVYPEPDSNSGRGEVRQLDSVIRKANTIITEKPNSKYLDDAYYLIAQAHYLKTEFFDAVEFFDYVYKTYPHEKDLRLSSLAWKARALMQLNNMEEAQITIDTALKHINESPQKTAEVYAAAAQLMIRQNKDEQAAGMIQKAISAPASKDHKLRWHYILAQLLENTGQVKDALFHYAQVAHSNVSFEMAFNANLNYLRLDDDGTQGPDLRISRLRALLKSDKNKEFRDQIYYRIGEVYLLQNQINEAIKSYGQAIEKSQKNITQKGITYLRLADIYFGKGNYPKAKAYYDTTLSTLPPSYPGFESIKKKAQNLDFLAGKFQIIAREDTLQALARMDKGQRDLRITELILQQIGGTHAGAETNSPETFSASINDPSVATYGKFYFNNSTALAQGASFFRRRWGNRPLADNWRRGNNASSEIVATSTGLPSSATVIAAPKATPDTAALRKQYMSSLPLTANGLQLSNDQIAQAYYDIGSFYKNIIQDEHQAILTFNTLLNRVPGSSLQPAVYYNLYLLYSATDSSKSDSFRERLLKEYPESSFAKVIRNPSYLGETDEKTAALNKAYNSAFELYQQRKYTEVIQQVQSGRQSFGQTSLSPQFEYLVALATGHTQKLPDFEASLKRIADSFANDQIVVPLVRQHLQYIGLHQEELLRRPTALLDNDDDQTFLEPGRYPVNAAQSSASQPRQATTLGKKKQAASSPVIAAKPQKQEFSVAGSEKQTPPANEPTTGQAAPVLPAIIAPNVPAPPVKSPSIFSPAGTGEYYFVVNVEDPHVNLSPSRFGIGQFNRSRYSRISIKHQLKAVNNENQLIFVGPFSNKELAADYERNILPLIKDIIKVSADKYDTFVISKENLEKLNTRAIIHAYGEFYKNNK